MDCKNKLADFATLEKKLGKPINMVLMDDNIFTFIRVMLCLSYPKTQFLKMRSLQDYKRYKNYLKINWKFYQSLKHVNIFEYDEAVLKGGVLIR